MWNTPSNEALKALPKLYSTEHIPLQDKLIHLLFFIGSCDWHLLTFHSGVLSPAPPSNSSSNSSDIHNPE